MVGWENSINQLSSSPKSANFCAIVGLLRVSFLIVTSCALLLAIRRLLAVLNNASFVFCTCVIDLSISGIAASNFLDAGS